METMTVQELMEKLKRMPKDAPVFMITDHSDDNYDEDTGRWRKAFGIDSVTKEFIQSDGWDGDGETNVLLDITY